MSRIHISDYVDEIDGDSDYLAVEMALADIAQLHPNAAVRSEATNLYDHIVYMGSKLPSRKQCIKFIYDSRSK